MALQIYSNVFTAFTICHTSKGLDKSSGERLNTKVSQPHKKHKTLTNKQKQKICIKNIEVVI